ncbi:MAG: dTDP-4-dehydrorhamnose reductase [Candidatus Dojkabacteria bacterium]|nr:dTDP-4-dehydrorhamnose reductase [Candidatus Dojkabacteria bacterium]
MKTKKILIIGADGMLGRAVFDVLKSEDYFLLTPSREILDITDKKSIGNFIEANKPDLIINCSAYTNVNEAEDTGKELNYLVNHIGLKNVVDSTSQYNVVLIHFSTDYVFGENKQDGYTEDDLPHIQLNEYGCAKRLGEIEVEKSKNKFFIFRVSWLFGPGKKNFVSTIAELAQKNTELNVVDDEFGVPTYTYDVAQSLAKFLENIETYSSGYYHMVNEGICSRFEEAKFIIDHLKLNCVVNPIKLKDYKRKANVPHYSILINTKLPKLRFWQEAVAEYIDKYIKI